MKKSPSLEKEDNQMQIENVDRISKLPDDMLLKILKSLSTEKAVQTSLLSKRWEGVWKQMPYLFFDMKNALKVELPLAEQSHFIAQLITKIINNHNGNLERCKILHMTPQTEDVDVLNTVIASCPSLKMLVLEIFQSSRSGCLKIHNDNLKFVHLTCPEIDNIEVSAALLDIFSVHGIELESGNNIVLDAPRLLQFGRRLWKILQSLPHIIYNISCDTQGNEKIGHEFVMNIENYSMVVFAILAVNVDMMNPKEVYMLKQVLDAWARDLQVLNIFFKDNDIHKKEGESSIDGIQNKWQNCFLSVDFRVRSVCLHNFNGLDEDQFALAASFVIQGKMMQSLMIETFSLPANKKLAVDIAVEKLMKLPKGNKNLNIQYI
ncbi:putative F-box protein At1g67390 [Brassica napus]|uniref:putative F-box protein At1g67390 n=1 Tax=Brassica napus TaxID=3708 RepID=UPI002078BB1F|nr:putative F-box protein At1g67390 [Brassica napus]